MNATSETKPASATPRAVATAASGVGIGAVAMAFLQGNPAVVARLADYALTLVVLGGIAWFIAAYAPKFLAAQIENAKSQTKMAESVTDLTGVIEKSMAREDDVRLALRDLSGEFEQLASEMREVSAATRAILKHHVAAAGGGT